VSVGGIRGILLLFPPSCPPNSECTGTSPRTLAFYTKTMGTRKRCSLIFGTVAASVLAVCSPATASSVPSSAILPAFLHSPGTLPTLGSSRAACGGRGGVEWAGRSLEGIEGAATGTGGIRQRSRGASSAQTTMGIEVRDYVRCQDSKVAFVRAAFGKNADVMAEFMRTNPYCADTELNNSDELKGKIALSLRGAEEGRTCSFVDKAKRVAEAGAVGLIIINSEDTLVSPGDSAREGSDIEIPVVGIRNSDAAQLPDGLMGSLLFQKVQALSSDERKHVRNVAMERGARNELAAMLLDDETPSEQILMEMDLLLSQHELVKASFGEEMETSFTLLEIEDVIDVATVIADNLGAHVVVISQGMFVLYRPSPQLGDRQVALQTEAGVGDEGGLGLEEELRDAVTRFTGEEDEEQVKEGGGVR